MQRWCDTSTVSPLRQALAKRSPKQFSLDHKCLYGNSWQSIQYLLRYFSPVFPVNYWVCGILPQSNLSCHNFIMNWKYFYTLHNNMKDLLWCRCLRGAFLKLVMSSHWLNPYSLYTPPALNTDWYAINSFCLISLITQTLLLMPYEFDFCHVISIQTHTTNRSNFLQIQHLVSLKRGQNDACMYKSSCSAV